MNNVTRSWKTSVMGALLLALSGFQIYSEPAKATDPNVMATVAAGIGLLAAKDANKTGTVESPKP